MFGHNMDQKYNIELLSLVLAYSFLSQYAPYVCSNDKLDDILMKPLAHASF